MVHHALHHEHLHMEKRDKLDNKMRFIHNAPEMKAAVNGADAVQTVYTQVLVTKTGAFTKPTAGFSTPAGAAAAAGTQGPDDSKAKASSLAAQQASYLSAKSLAQAPNTTPAAAASTSVEPNTKPIQRTRSTESHTPVTVPTQRTRTTALSSSSAVEAAVGGTPLTQSRGPEAVAGTPLSNSHDSVISQKSDGMTTGAKAGLAIGILLVIAGALGLLLFCWRRRKQQARTDGAEQLDEKRATKDSFFGGSSAAAARGPQRESVQSEKSFQSTRTAATAPRLSLRPVTQFLPNILTGERNNTAGGSLGVPAMSEKPRSNPFDDPAALSEKNGASNPFDDGDGAVVDGKKTPGHSQNSSWEGSEPATPKSTKFGTAAAVAITGASAARGPNNVHRVQLDFKPSMEDEIELRSGQLVRMVHEYDDGWVSHYLRYYQTSANLSPGSLHASRSLSTRCLPAYLPV